MASNPDTFQPVLVNFADSTAVFAVFLATSWGNDGKSASTATNVHPRGASKSLVFPMQSGQDLPNLVRNGHNPLVIDVNGGSASITNPHIITMGS